jgi:bifunctional enzyme CysN/CysC
MSETTTMPSAPPAGVTGDLLRIATAGSVDDGKSTLIGRLLYDTKQIFEDQLEQVAEASVRSDAGGHEIDLSLLTDGLRAEREQGITIDVAYRHFATPRRAFILADTPGHVRYTRNMVTGASTADLALVLVDARNGVVQQSRRHLFIASLLRIPHIIVCVNKMDLVDYSETVFEEICRDFGAFASRLDIADISFVPVSALCGDNVVQPAERMPWYGGPPLLYQLEHLQVSSDRNLIDARFPVQWVIRPGEGAHRDFRGYAGKMASGVLRVGDEVVVLPSGAQSRVIGMERSGRPVAEGFPPLALTIHLADELDVSRGDMICRPRNRPEVARDIDATVCWMSDVPSRRQGRYLVKSTTRTVRGVLAEVLHRIDVDTLHHDESAAELGLNDIGRVRLRTSSPMLFDPYDRNRATGAFILIDEATNDTVAAGMIRGSAAPSPTVGVGVHQHSANVTWQGGRLGCVGATVWITGLPASGKSTLGGLLEERLVADGIASLRLDGDNLRHGLNGNLGFEPSDRAENVRRTAHAARLLAEAGNIAIVTLVSPYASDRLLARRIHEDDGLGFIEVFVDTPLEECERRDPKGLYAKARAGELQGLTGVDDVYEMPTQPELRVTSLDIDSSVSALRSLLHRIGVSA